MSLAIAEPYCATVLQSVPNYICNDGASSSAVSNVTDNLATAGGSCGMAPLSGGPKLIRLEQDSSNPQTLAVAAVEPHHQFCHYRPILPFEKEYRFSSGLAVPPSGLPGKRICRQEPDQRASRSAEEGFSNFLRSLHDLLILFKRT